MNHLFALLVAIDKYHQNGIKDLSGCLNDLAGMELSLDTYCRKKGDLSLHKRVLKNRAATRRAVIDGFKLFDEASDRDVCLFYFGGHGAQIDAPKEFWNEPDKMLEALVCHVEHGNDNLLIDKELSFLINQAQRGKEVHFVVITDCCHSGSNTKDSSFNVRTIPPNFNTREVNAYWGWSEYQADKNQVGEIVRLSAPVGKHFKLGACMSGELSKEKVLGADGKMRGVFTFALLQVLKDNGYGVSYSNLVTKARIIAQALVRDQSPQLEMIAVPPQECSRTFLNGVLENERPTFQVCYEEAQGRWVIKVGHVYGIREGDVAVLADGTEVAIKKVYIAYSLLDFGPLAFHARRDVYDATIKPAFRKTLNLAFAPGCNEAAKDVFMEVLKETASPAISFDSKAGADYALHAVDNTLALTYPESRTPVFSRIRGQGKAEARLFLNILEQIAEFHRIVAIANPNTTIRESEVGVELRIVDAPHTHQNPDTAPATLIEDWRGENVFRYSFDDTVPGGPWHPPAFRLSIVNHSKAREFWVSALYCGVGYIPDRTHYTSTSFSITNRFLEQELLKKKTAAKMADEINDPYADRHVAYESIQLSLLDDYFDRGYNEIKDVIKVFISTEELDTSPFNMKGVAIDTEGQLAEKPAGQLQPPPQPDWRTYEIPITIVKPRDLGILNTKQDKAFQGLTIVGHPTFSARVVLSTMEEFIRSTRLTGVGDASGSSQDSESIGRPIYMPRPETAFGNENVHTIELTDGLGQVEGCSVIEFFRAAGAEFISPEQMLTLRVNPKEIAVAETHRLILVGYSSAKRAYYTLGTMNADHEIKVDLLPPNSPSLISGLGGSIKLVLLNVRSDFVIAPYPRQA